MKEFKVGDEVVAIGSDFLFYAKGAEGVVQEYPEDDNKYGLIYVKWLKGDYHGSCWFVQPHEIQHKERM